MTHSEKMKLWPLSPALSCQKCGAPCWDNAPVIRPNGDAIVFTVCIACWEAQDFVNGKPARVAIMPIIMQRAAWEAGW